jgi:hypothetical protein
LPGDSKIIGRPKGNVKRSCERVSESSKKPPEKRLLDRVRDTIRLKHDSIRTEEAYVNLIRRFILLYVSGLRLLECLRPRVKDLGLDRRAIIVRDIKGVDAYSYGARTTRGSPQPARSPV